MTQEQISALIDNELSDDQIDLVLAALRNAEGRAAWDAYHHIGDVLRSDDMVHDFSPNFTSSLMARLDAEPTVIAPQIKPAAEPLPLIAAGGGRNASTTLRRFGVPTAVAAVAVLALISSPRLMVAMKGGSAGGDRMAPVMVVSQEKPAMVERVAAADTTVSIPTRDGVEVRDLRLNEYMQAHQRFSPAWNSAAQYARSATFTTDAAK
jgi:sigma-E factor negative regulatory protein RseA